MAAAEIAVKYDALSDTMVIRSSGRNQSVTLGEQQIPFHILRSVIGMIHLHARWPSALQDRTHEIIIPVQSRMSEHRDSARIADPIHRFFGRNPGSEAYPGLPSPK